MSWVSEFLGTDPGKAKQYQSQAAKLTEEQARMARELWDFTGNFRTDLTSEMDANAPLYASLRSALTDGTFTGGGSGYSGFMPQTPDWTNPLSPAVKRAYSWALNTNTDTNMNRMRDTLGTDVIDRGLAGGGKSSSMDTTNRLALSNFLTKNRAGNQAQIATMEQDRGDQLRQEASTRAMAILQALLGRQTALGEYGLGQAGTAMGYTGQAAQGLGGIGSAQQAAAAANLQAFLKLLGTGAGMAFPAAA
jgi:hypothetical protein